MRKTTSSAGDDIEPPETEGVFDPIASMAHDPYSSAQWRLEQIHRVVHAALALGPFAPSALGFEALQAAARFADPTAPLEIVASALSSVTVADDELPNLVGSEAGKSHLGAGLLEADDETTLELRAVETPFRHLSRFQTRIESAATLMSCAFIAASVTDFAPDTRKSKLRVANGGGGWFESLVNGSLDRFAEVRNALVHEWASTPLADHLAAEAFAVLAEMTLARDSLLRIHLVDRVRARTELVRLLDPIAEEVAATARLLVGEQNPPSPKKVLEAVQSAILAKAGGVWTLSQAAEALEVTRQGLHKRIVSGTVLGVMRGHTLAVPCCQFEQIGVKSKPVAGLARIIKLFRDASAGDWSALQFLVEDDPNLNRPPIKALRAGGSKEVELAARAYLSLDEG